MLVSISNTFRQFKLPHLMLVLSLLIILHMLITTFSSTRSAGQAIRSAEHQSLASYITSLAQVVENKPLKFETLKELIYSTRWGDDNSGYAFLADGMTGEILIYPPDPRKEGDKVLEINLVEGGTLEQAIRRSHQRGISEIVHYQYSKPGMNEEISKAVYLYPLKQERTVLLAGIYLDKSDLILQDLYKRISIPIVAFSLLLLFFISYLKRRTHYLYTAMSHLTKGDYDNTSAIKKANEIAFLASYLGVSQKNLKEIANQQSSSSYAQQINKEMAHQSDEFTLLDKAMEETHNRITKLMEGISLLKQTMISIDLPCQDNIQHCIEIIEQTNSDFDHSLAVFNTVKQTMGASDLTEREELSNSTNLISFTIAIETARASLNVIEQEIKRLSSSTQATSKVLTTAINNIETDINHQKKERVEEEALVSMQTLNNGALRTTKNVHRFNQTLVETKQTIEELIADSLAIKEQMTLLDQQLSQFDFDYSEEACTQKVLPPCSTK